jgi:hypothetical protein
MTISGGGGGGGGRKGQSLGGGEEEKVSPEDNLALEAKFTEEEIKLAIDGSYVEGALGPDGFSFMFY